MTPTQILIFTVVMSIIVGFFLFAVINRICDCIEKIRIAKGEKETDE